MEKFLGIILIIILSLYVLQWLGKLLLPFILKKLMQKMAEKAFGQHVDFSQQNQYSEQNNKQEGDVTVTYNQKSQNRKSKEEGEYIDFEDVK